MGMRGLRSGSDEERDLMGGGGYGSGLILFWGEVLRFFVGFFCFILLVF